MYPPSNDPISLPVQGPPRARSGPAAPMSLLSATNAVLRQRWGIVMAALVVSAAVVVVTLAQPRVFTATATFIPESATAQPSGLSGVASQLGISMSEGPNTESPAFYADLLLSREVLGSVADSAYRIPADPTGRTASLADVLALPADNEALRRHRTLEFLRRHVGASVTPKTGAVVLTVSTRSPELSFDIAEQMLAQVAAFNANRRQSRAVAEREFIEQRALEARTALAVAERRLEAFLTANRRISGSPALEFERERLMRDLSVRQQVYLTLSESYERARIEEVRSTPVITMIDAPELPLVPNRRLLILKAAAGLVFGLVLGVVFALLRQAMADTRRSSSDEYAEFEALRSEAAADLRRPWRPLLRRWGRGVAAS